MTSGFELEEPFLESVKGLKGYQRLVGVSHEYLRDFDPKKNIIAIVNTDKIGQPGRHWVALVSHNSVIHYYDSLGGKPLPFIAKWARMPITYYSSQQQPDESDKCGFYALRFIRNAAELIGAAQKGQAVAPFDFYDFGLDYLEPTKKNESRVLQ